MENCLIHLIYLIKLNVCVWCCWHPKVWCKHFYTLFGRYEATRLQIYLWSPSATIFMMWSYCFHSSKLVLIKPSYGIVLFCFDLFSFRMEAQRNWIFARLNSKRHEDPYTYSRSTNRCYSIPFKTHRIFS